MSDCPHCSAAVSRWTWGGYTADCEGCQIRALAQSPLVYECEQTRHLLPEYRHALETLFGEQWLDGHERVKVERARIAALRQVQSTRE